MRSGEDQSSTSCGFDCEINIRLISGRIDLLVEGGIGYADAAYHCSHGVARREFAKFL